MGADGRQPGLGHSQGHLVRSATPGASSNAGSACRDRRLGRVDPVRHRFGMPVEGTVEGQVHAGGHGAQRMRLGTEVAAGGLGAPAERVEVAQ